MACKHPIRLVGADKTRSTCYNPLGIENCLDEKPLPPGAGNHSVRTPDGHVYLVNPTRYASREDAENDKRRLATEQHLHLPYRIH